MSASAARAQGRAERAPRPPRFRITASQPARVRWLVACARRSEPAAGAGAAARQPCDTHRLRCPLPLVAPAPSASRCRSFVLEAAVLAIVSSATLLGAQGRPVRVEVHVANGLPGFTIVGLPDEACRESRDRVRAALLSSGLPWPQQRVTVNLAPSAVRKGGSGLDLPIAVGVLVASEVVPTGVDRGAGLRRRARPRRLGPPRDRAWCRSPPPSTVTARWSRRHASSEASLTARGPVHAVGSVAELVAALRGEAPWPEPPSAVEPAAPVAAADLAEVRGQTDGPPRGRGRRRRRPSPAPARSAGLGQDDARCPPALRCCRRSHRRRRSRSR